MCEEYRRVGIAMNYMYIKICKFTNLLDCLTSFWLIPLFHHMPKNRWQYRLSDELEHDLGYTAGGSSPGAIGECPQNDLEIQEDTGTK